MVIPEGYKQTEIGVIPEDWEVNYFKNVGSFFKGSGISMKDTKPTGLPCIMYGDIYVKFDTHFTKCDFKIDENTANKSTKAITNDLFFTASGETAEEIGKCVSYQGVKDIYIGGDIIAIRPTNKYDSLFLAFVQNSSLLIKQKASLAQGHTVVHINSNNIASLKFAYPELKEQQQIAQSLLDVDGLVSSLEKLIEKKKAIKQGAMQALLTGKKRLSGFTDDWKPYKLGDLCAVSGRIGFRGYTKFDLVNKGFGAITFSPSNIINQKIDFTKCDYISFYKYDESPEIQVFNGDIIFCKTASIGKTALIKNLKEKATINPQFVLLNKFKCNNVFLYYILSGKKFTEQITSITGGSTILTISQEQFKQQIVYMPTEEEQNNIVLILSNMDDEIELLEQKLEKARQLKQGMMQQLLTGKIRLI